MEKEIKDYLTYLLFKYAEYMYDSYHSGCSYSRELNSLEAAICSTLSICKKLDIPVTDIKSSYNGFWCFANDFNTFEEVMRQF